MQCTINVRSRMLARHILAKTRNSPNSPNIIARQNLLIYSITDCKDSDTTWEFRIMPPVTHLKRNVLPHYHRLLRWFQMHRLSDRVMYRPLIFWVHVRLGQKYYTPQVWPDRGANSWPPVYDSIFHVTETPALTTQPSPFSIDTRVKKNIIFLQKIAFLLQ